MIPQWSSTKVVQAVLVGCICRSRGQKIGFQKAIFKNLLLWNYKAQSFYIWCITSPLPNSTGMVPGWSPTKIIQMVPIGCICRSWGQIIGLQKAIFKTFLLWNYKAQSFYIWYNYNIIYRSSTKVVQIMPLGSKLTPARGSQFYIELYWENFKWLLILNR